MESPTKTYKKPVVKPKPKAKERGDKKKINTRYIGALFLNVFSFMYALIERFESECPLFLSHA